MSAVCGPYRPFPTFMRAGGAQCKWSCSSGESRSPRGAGSSPPRRRALERHVSCSQLSLAALSSGRATASLLGMGSVIAAGYMALKSKYEIQLTGSSGLKMQLSPPMTEARTSL